MIKSPIFGIQAPKLETRINWNFQFRQLLPDQRRQSARQSPSEWALRKETLSLTEICATKYPCNYS